MEKFYIDVARVYEKKEQQSRLSTASSFGGSGGSGLGTAEGENRGGESEQSDSQSRQEKKEHFIERMDRYLNFARTQVESIKQTVSFTLDRNHLLLRPAAPTVLNPAAFPPANQSQLQTTTHQNSNQTQTTANPPVGMSSGPATTSANEQHLLRLQALLVGKRNQLETTGRALKAHAARLRATVRRGQSFARGVYDLSNFWNLRLSQTGGATYGYDLWVPYGFNMERAVCGVVLESESSSDLVGSSGGVGGGGGGSGGSSLLPTSSPSPPATPATPSDEVRSQQSGGGSAGTAGAHSSSAVAQKHTRLALIGLDGEDEDTKRKPVVHRLLRAQRRNIHARLQRMLMNQAARYCIVCCSTKNNQHLLHSIIRSNNETT